MTRESLITNRNADHIINNTTSNIIIGCLLVMLFAMTFSVTILKTTSYLIYFYALAFIIQIVLLLYLFSRESIRVSYNWAILTGIYCLISFVPLISDVIHGISINSFDYINCIVKIVNFIFFCVLFQNYSTDKIQFERIMRFIVAIGIIACVFSFITEFDQFLTIRTISNTNALVIRSFFSNRNQYSAYLVCAFTAALYLYEGELNKKKYFIYSLFLIGILTTFSRGALFSVLIIALLDFYQKKRTKKKMLFIIFVLIAFLLVIPRIDFQSIGLGNYLRLNNFDSGRVGLWKIAYDMAKEHMFLGMGFYTASDEIVKRGIGLNQFHSMYMDLLVGGGILELIFILVIVFLIFKKCKKATSGSRYYRIYSSSLLSFLVYGFVESLSLFSLSYGDTLYMIMYITIPLIISNMQETGMGRIRIKR